MMMMQSRVVQGSELFWVITYPWPSPRFVWATWFSRPACLVSLVLR